MEQHPDFPGECLCSRPRADRSTPGPPPRPRGKDKGTGPSHRPQGPFGALLPDLDAPALSERFHGVCGCVCGCVCVGFFLPLLLPLPQQAFGVNTQLLSTSWVALPTSEHDGQVAASPRQVRPIGRGLLGVRGAY